MQNKPVMYYSVNHRRSSFLFAGAPFPRSSGIPRSGQRLFVVVLSFVRTTAYAYCYWPWSGRT